MADPGDKKEVYNLRFLFAYGRFSMKLRHLSTHRRGHKFRAALRRELWGYRFAKNFRSLISVLYSGGKIWRRKKRCFIRRVRTKFQASRRIIAFVCPATQRGFGALPYVGRQRTRRS